MVNREREDDVLAGVREGATRIGKGSKGVADRVPVYAQMSHHSARLVGESTIDFFTKAETFLRCELAADIFYEIDAATINYDVYNIESEALGAKLIWNEEQIPAIDPQSHLLRSAEGYEDLRPIKFGSAGRMPYVLEINRRLMDMGLSPKVRFTGLFTFAANLLGLEELILAIVTEPERVHRLMSFLADEVVGPWIQCQRESCGRNETATGSDALASPPLIGVEMVREFCLRYIERLEEKVGGIRLAGLWGESCLRNPRELLDIKRAGTAGTIQVLDPDVSALGPRLFKGYADQYGIGLIMGLDAHLIASGPVEEIAARARMFIEEAGMEGRFVLFMNDIAYTAPVENVKAVISAAREYVSDASNRCYVRRERDTAGKQGRSIEDVYRRVGRMMAR